MVIVGGGMRQVDEGEGDNVGGGRLDPDVLLHRRRVVQSREGEEKGPAGGGAAEANSAPQARTQVRRQGQGRDEEEAIVESAFAIKCAAIS